MSFKLTEISREIQYKKSISSLKKKKEITYGVPARSYIV